MDNISLYLNFVLLALYGRTAQADALMRTTAGRSIRRVAGFLAQEYPITPVPLYRGILLDPAQRFRTDPQLTFLSWSEDPDVGKWFACPRSVISAYVAQLYPHYRGYIITLPTACHVLFHYSWANVFDGLSVLARQHPQMGVEGERQIAWSLKTQREVLTENILGLKPEAAPNVDETALDQRFAPPWMNT